MCRETDDQEIPIPGWELIWITPRACRQNMTTFVCILLHELGHIKLDTKNEKEAWDFARNDCTPLCKSIVIVR
jgi:hypothetical protein